MQKVIISLLFFLTIVSAQNWAVDYLRGMHRGFGLQLNQTTVAYITEKIINHGQLSLAYSEISSKPLETRDHAILLFNQIFTNLSISLAEVVGQDKNIDQLLNYTLTVFANPLEFERRADLYELNSGLDAYDTIQQASGIPFAMEYFETSGSKLGYYLRMLYLVSPLDTFIIKYEHNVVKALLSL